MNTRLKDVEIKTVLLITDTSELQKKVEDLQVHSAKLEAQLVDYEGRSRRNNVRILGIPEKSEEPAMDLFVEELVMNYLKPTRLSKFFTVERAHRVPGG